MPPTGSWIQVGTDIEEVAAEPWSLHWREFKTGTDEFESLLHDPASFLLESRLIPEPGWRVTTSIANHQVPLTHTSSCLLAMVMPEYRTVALTMYKHEPE